MRNPLPPAPRRTLGFVKISISISAETHDQAVALARAERINRSAAIERLIKAGLAAKGARK